MEEAKRIAEMNREAEKIERQHQHRPEEKLRRLKVKCPRCGYRVEYAPKPDFDGNFKCPQCGKVFKLIHLDNFS